MANRNSGGVLIILLGIIFGAARALDSSYLVRGLPGQPHVGFDQYAGHITVNEKTGTALFYWLYRSTHTNEAQIPLVLWLNGGPGCSSVAFGALGEMGPFRVNKNGTGLVRHKHAWNEVSDLLFLESPHGVGFSYTDSTRDDLYYSNKQTAEENLMFLIRWFKKFPEFRKSDFYLTGESYAGQYVPSLASHILAYNKRTKDQSLRINLKGFALGNAFTSAYYETGQTLEFLYSHSLISREAYEAELTSCYLTKLIDRHECSQSMMAVDSLTKFVDRFNVYGPTCSIGSSNKHGRDFENYENCPDLATAYLNLPEVQAALNVDNRPVSWKRCSDTVFYNFHENDPDGRKMLKIYKELFKAGIKIWIYSGDFDSVVPTMSTRRWIDALNLTIQNPWYPWKHKDQVGGWSEVYSELTFVTIRGSGHLVPTDKPEEALQLLKNFLQGTPLPSFPVDL